MLLFDSVIVMYISARNCSSWEYHCPLSGGCINKNWLCDGERDCSHGEDEQLSMCGRSSTLPYMYNTKI